MEVYEIGVPLNHLIGSSILNHPAMGVAPFMETTIIYHYIPLYTIIYHYKPYHYIPLYSIIYHYIPLYTILYHYIPLYTIIYYQPLWTAIYPIHLIHHISPHAMFRQSKGHLRSSQGRCFGGRHGSSSCGSAGCLNAGHGIAQLGSTGSKNMGWHGHFLKWGYPQILFTGVFQDFWIPPFIETPWENTWEELRYTLQSLKCW